MDRIVIMGTNNKSFNVIYNGKVVSRSILQIQDDLRLLKKGKAQRVRIRDKDLLIYYKGGIVTLKSYRELGHNCPATRDYIAHVKKYINLSTKAKHVGALVVASSIALGVASFKSNKVQAKNNDMTVTSTKVLDDMHDLSGSYTMNNNPNFNIHDYENITIPEDDVEVLDTTPTLDVPTEDSEKQQEAVTSTYTDKAELNLEYESRAYTDRNLLVRNNEETMAAIKKYANKYMIDENLVMAIASQERGTHSQTMDDGGGLGIMQVQVAVHPDGSAFSTVINDNGNIKKSQFVYHHNEYITLDGNIEAGCALLQYYLNYFNGNMAMAVYAYNSGQGPVNNAIVAYASETGLSYESIMANKSDLDWTKYLDREYYLPAVLSWLDTDNLTMSYAHDDIVETTNYSLNHTKSLAK
ncbi:MAG: transglycosylase SLT domain-containing protein [Bacilli bacterium]|nr:transglycosylase SLT domain-containing protein [Bacilli bacterium]